MDVLTRLNELLKQNNWSRYRLAKECGLSEETLTNIFRRGTMPTLGTLQIICEGFKISLSQFFAEDEMIEMSAEMKELFDNWKFLTPKQKDAVLGVIKAMKSDTDS
ncbi:MAG: helix-turn-helix transcriptional regulator [Clostridia bacterium]|nr:helix-turn-helix transcriptional regulator [Clostridia bacterium]